MPNEDPRKLPAKAHSLRLEGRERLGVSGVEDVSGFDESLIVLSIALGDLVVRGRELHVERIDLEQGELVLRGCIQELCYDEPARGRSLWSRLFG